MFLLPYLVALTAVALASATEDYDDIVDLQQLLQNVSRTYREFSDGGGYRADIGVNVNLINDNINRVNENLNGMEGNINANANRSEKNQLEMTQLLREIVQALRTTEPARSRTERVYNETAMVVEGPDDAEDCSELYKLGKRRNGIYQVTLPGVKRTIRVYCDMTTDGGGWTVFQRRGDFNMPQNYFFKNWSDYKTGFGDLSQEFWLGNDNLAVLTQHKMSVLRVDLWDPASNHAYAKYGSFRLDDEKASYKLTLGAFSGTAGNSLTQHHNQAFSTPDKGALAEKWGGPWWHYPADCYSSLNGLYLKGQSSIKAVKWYTWKNHQNLAATELKIRSASF